MARLTEDGRPSVIYVAGKLSADTRDGEKANRRAAIGYANHLRARGYVVICPHEMGDGCTVMSEGDWLFHGLVILARCDECRVIGDYSDSRGTIREIETCHALGIPVRYITGGMLTRLATP